MAGGDLNVEMRRGASTRIERCVGGGAQGLGHEKYCFGDGCICLSGAVLKRVFGCWMVLDILRTFDPVKPRADVHFYHFLL